jgi:hypothetical protein
MMDTDKRERGKLRRWVWKKAPGYPKRPLSAYNCFYRDERLRMVHEIPKSDERGGLTGMSRRIGPRWKALSKEMKQPYEKEALEEKVKYGELVAIFKASALSEFDRQENFDNPLASINVTALEMIPEQTRQNTGNSSLYLESFSRLKSNKRSLDSFDDSENILIKQSCEDDAKLSNIEHHGLSSFQSHPLFKETFGFAENNHLFNPSTQSCRHRYREVSPQVSENFNVPIVAGYLPSIIDNQTFNINQFQAPPPSNEVATRDYLSHDMHMFWAHQEQQVNMLKKKEVETTENQVLDAVDSSLLSLDYEFSFPFDDQIVPSGYWQQDKTTLARNRPKHNALSGSFAPDSGD